MGVYTTVEDVCNSLNLPYGKWVTLSADSGVSEANKDRINVGAANIKQFPVGAVVQVAEMTVADDDDTITRMETATVSDTTAALAYFTVSSDLGDDYTTANNAAVRLLTPFNTKSGLTWSRINEMILEAEDEIDNRCHTTFKTGGKVVEQWFEFSGGRVIASYPWSFSRPYGYTGTQWKMKLNGSPVKTLATTADTAYTGYTGDYLTVYNGNESEEWFNSGNPNSADSVSLKTQGRDDDYWLNYEEGWLFFVDSKPSYGEFQVKIRFRTGETLWDSETDGSARRDISKACRLTAQIELIQNEQYRVTQPGGDSTGRIDPEKLVDKWTAQVTKLLLPHIAFTGYIDYK